MKLSDFIEKYGGKKNVGNTPGNSGECVGLIMVYIQELGLSHIWGNARDIFQNAPDNQYEKIENAPDIYPNEGDILCWNGTMGGNHGHIAIVISSDPEKDTVEVFESNNPYENPPRKHTYSNWRGIIGWLKPHVLEGEENDLPELTEECLEYKRHIEVLLEAKEALEIDLETSRDDNNTLVKKINELDIKYIELSKKYVDDVGELADQRDKCQKDYADLYSDFERDADTAFKAIRDLERRLLNLQKSEVNENMNKITTIWESLPKTLKVFCFIALSTILSELAIELGGLEQTFLIRTLAQLINMGLVIVKEGVPAIKAKLKK